MSAMPFPTIWTPPRRKIWQRPRWWKNPFHAMAAGDAMLDADGYRMLNADGSAMLDSGSGECCLFQARLCSDNTLAAMYVRKSQFPAFPATFYFYDSPSATCYYVQSTDTAPCTSTPIASPTTITNCADARCGPALYEALSCADGVTKRYVRQSDFHLGVDVNGFGTIIDNSDGRCFTVTTNVAPTGSTPLITSWTDLNGCGDCCPGCDPDPTHYSKLPSQSNLLTYSGISTPGSGCSAMLGGAGFGGFGKWSMSTLSGSYCIPGAICPCDALNTASDTTWPSIYTGFAGYTDSACTNVQPCSAAPLPTTNGPLCELLFVLARGPNGEVGVRIVADDGSGCNTGGADHVYFLGWTAVGVFQPCTSTITLSNQITSIDLQPTNSISTIDAYFPWESGTNFCASDEQHTLHCGSGGTVVLTPHMTTADCT
jgi:hypothetical protein